MHPSLSVHVELVPPFDIDLLSPVDKVVVDVRSGRCRCFIGAENRQDARRVKRALCGWLDRPLFLLSFQRQKGA